MAGAREAHGVIRGLVAAGRTVVASLPEQERAFPPIPISTRLGAFADAGDIGNWFEAREVSAVIDASHVFDDRLSAAVRRAAGTCGLPYLRLRRRPWSATPQDRWTHFADLRQAVAATVRGDRVFSTTGWASLCDFARFKGEAVFLRQTQPSREPSGYRFIRFVQGMPPFSLSHEQDLFRDLRVSKLICRNLGGEAGMSKLEAARRLGVPVMMIDRPVLPADVCVESSVEAALAWRARL